MKDGWISQTGYSEVVGLLPGVTHFSRNAVAPCIWEERERRRLLRAAWTPGHSRGCRSSWLLIPGYAHLQNWVKCQHLLPLEVHQGQQSTMVNSKARENSQAGDEYMALWLFCPHVNKRASHVRTRKAAGFSVNPVREFCTAPQEFMSQA